MYGHWICFCWCCWIFHVHRKIRRTFVRIIEFEFSQALQLKPIEFVVLDTSDDNVGISHFKHNVGSMQTLAQSVFITAHMQRKHTHKLCQAACIHIYQFVCRSSASEIQVAPPLLLSTSLARVVVVAVAVVDNAGAGAAADVAFCVLWSLTQFLLVLLLSFFNFRHHYSHWMLPQFIQTFVFNCIDILYILLNDLQNSSQALNTHTHTLTQTHTHR